jgi:MFS family permease
MQPDKTFSTEAQPRTSIWRNGAFRLLWGAQALSDMGTGITTLAYPLLMLTLTHSPVQAGAVSAVSTLPYLLFGLVAGALADRWNRKRVMVICDTFRAINMLSIPLAMWLWHVTPTHLYVTAFVGGVFYVLFSAADAGAVPNVVEKDQLTSAVAALQATSSATAVLAPPLGGALFQLFRGLPFLADALSYLASAIALSAVRLEFQQSQDKLQTTLRSEIVEGLRWLWSHPTIRTVATAAAGLQLAMAGAGLVVIIAAQQAHASAGIIGLVLASIGLGGVAGSLVAPRLKARFGFGRILMSVMWAQGALWALIGLFSHVLLMIAVLLSVFAATAQIFGITALTYQLSVTPDNMQSRVGSAFKLIAWSSFPLGAAIAGVLLDRLGPTTTSLAFAAWVSAIALFASRSRSGLRTHSSDPATPTP